MVCGAIAFAVVACGGGGGGGTASVGNGAGSGNGGGGGGGAIGNDNDNDLIVPNPKVPNAIAISWALPTRNVDGTELTNVTGYRIVYGTSATELAQSVELRGAGATNHLITGLAPGIYYLALITLTAAG